MAISSSGNITLNRAAGEHFEIVRYDTNGTALDLSEADLRFVVEGLLDITPGQHPTDPEKRLLHLNAEHATALGARVHRFALLQTQDGILPPLWQGTISASGFAPPERDQEPAEPQPPVITASVDVTDGVIVKVIPASVVQLETTGAPGPRGPQGIPGNDGRAGLDGEQGLPGPAGEPADPAITNALSARLDGLTSTVTAIQDLAPEDLNAFAEVAAALNNDPEFAITMTTALARRVRTDAAQALTSTERNVARSNIDAASIADVTGKLARDSYVRSLQITASGKPPANALLGGAIVPQGGTIDVAASAFRADTPPTASVALIVKRSGTAIGSITFAAGSATGVISLTSTTLLTGDRLSIHMPSAADASFADLIGCLVVRL